MKKSHIAISALSLAMILSGITGCNGKENQNGSSDTLIESTSSSDSENEDNSSVPDTESEPLSDDVKELLEKYPKAAEYIGRDGNVMPLDRITEIKYYDDFPTKVTYGLGYMTYGMPIFATTIENDDWKSEGDGFSDVIDWLCYRRDEIEESFTNTKFFMVKPGDRLENGLVVKSAETVCEVFTPKQEKEFSKPFTILSKKIEFDGTLTLEGVLYKYEGNPQYFSLRNDVFFYPDTTQNEFVPIDSGATVELLGSDVGVAHSGSYYLGNLGNIDGLPSVDYDVDAIFGDKNYARVKITLKDICIGSVDQDSQSPQRAKIADAELLD